MNSDQLPYLLPYGVSLLISTGVAVVCWRRRAVNGAGLYALAVLVQASWTLGYIFELSSSSLDSKIFWDNFQFWGLLLSPWMMVEFTLTFTETMPQRSRWLRGVNLAVIGLFMGSVVTDSYTHLVRLHTRIIPGSPFAELHYDFSIMFWIMIVYVYGIMLVAVYLLSRLLLRSQRAFQLQIAALLVGILVPLAGGIPIILNITLSFHRDLTPLTFAVGNVIVAWGLFYFRLFDLVPMARDSVIDNMSDPVMVLDIQNRLVDLNPAARATLNLPASALIGRPAREVYAQWRGLVEQFRDVHDLHTEIHVDIDNEPNIFELAISPLYDRRHQLVGRVLVAHNITARRRIEDALQERTTQIEAANRDLARANEQLQTLNRVKDEFVSNVSHELKTPITNLKLRLHLLTREPVRSSQHMVAIQRESDRLDQLIESLLTLSRLDQDRLQVNPTSLNLNALAEEYVVDRASLAESKGLALTLAAQPDLPPVHGDRRLLGQTLSILLTNALNYTPSGGKVVVKTQSRLQDSQMRVGFSVQDNGPGILPEEQSRLFSRFFRGSAGHESGLPGTGLGLAIAQEIVTRHQGEIGVESAGVPGEGATFYVWLPPDP